MNFIVAGLFSKNLIALNGAFLLNLAHGISSAALFFCMVYFMIVLIPEISIIIEV